MVSYLDIINSFKNPKDESLNQDSEVVSSALLNAASDVSFKNTDLERFRSMTNRMQNIANASIRQEIERIIMLPIIQEPTEEEIRLVSSWYITRPSSSLHTLLPEQVKAMIQFHEYGSLVCPIKVGGGKTLVSVLIVNDAFTQFGKKRILLIDPPHLIDQLRATELPFYRKHISINVPFHWIAGESAPKRKLLARSGRTGCYVVSYSLLSGADGAEVMDAIAPDLIIGDEIHCIASANPSARNRRFKEIVKKFNPQIVGLSGTITKKSPRDYHFLVSNALQERAFVPRPAMLADEWAKIIDSSASSIDQFQSNMAPQPGPIKLLVKWAKEHFPAEHKEYPNNLVGFRRAFKKRMETCPGVISSDSDEGGVSLRVSNIKISTEEKKASPGWDTLQEHVKKLLNEWVAPNGDEIDYQIHLWQWRYTLEGFGFYNNLHWPEPEKIARHRRLSEKDTLDLLERSRYQYFLQQEYHKELRKWIRYHARTGLDTPFLIGGDMANHGDEHVGATLYKMWKDAKDAMFEGIIERTSSVVRVCDFRAKAIVNWAKKWHKERPNKAAIIWYKHNGVGMWLKEIFQEEDLPVLYCPAGNIGRTNLSDRTKGDYFAIASFDAYSDGLNLQYHHDTEFFAQMPREAYKVHQGIGRVRRTGQAEDEVRMFVSICSEFDRVLFASVLNDAAYIHQTSAHHNLLMADYDEKPALIPYSVMVEWGAEPQVLNREAQKLLIDKFGGDQGE